MQQQKLRNLLCYCSFAKSSNLDDICVPLVALNSIVQHTLLDAVFTVTALQKTGCMTDLVLRPPNWFGM